MSDLSDISFDTIQNLICIFLRANENVKMSQFVLYSKLIERLNLKNKYINDKFKRKFLIVLKNLKNINDDIEITIDNKIINAVCKNDNELLRKNYDVNEADVENGYDETVFENIDIYNYIIENKLYDEYDYEDSNGNTIYHDLISYNNNENIQKLILENKFKFYKKNNFDKIPSDYIKTQETTNIIIKNLLFKNKELEERILKIENVDLLKKVNEITIVQFLKIKLLNISSLQLFKLISILILSLLVIYFILI